MIRTYSELSKLNTADERFEYLRLNGAVGSATFGFDRYINQIFYKSKEWKKIRNQVLMRDNGHDMGLLDDDYEIVGSVYVHHMNPISLDKIVERSSDILNPEYLVCVSFNTHQAIHYGDKDLLPVVDIPVRVPGDTCLWR